MSALTDRFDSIRRRMEDAARRAGRTPGSLRLVAVSKLHEAAPVAELAAYWAGLDAAPFTGPPAFGENYMQEAREKIPEVDDLLRPSRAPRPEWHFIGHVQSKTAKDVLGRFDLIHTLDSVKLAEALAKVQQSHIQTSLDGVPAPQPVLIQVNVGREPQKSGVDPEGLEALINAVAPLPELSLQGLMCIPPLAEIGAASRPYFVMLRELRDQMEKRCGLALPQLSMGMSDDFEAAIEEGGTLIRIGTDIFGPRERS
jgi:pyridoxal phosphate enzyme (YggS family)